MKELVYAGSPIGERDEKLCLTDMWRAAGSDPSKQPAKWRELPGTHDFVEYIGGSLNLRKSEDEFFQVTRGGPSAGTWAHWQIALAYAQYLSPEFHAWCNEVVRAHYEKRNAPASVTAIGEMFDEKLSPVVRDIANVQMAYERLDDKVTLIYKRVDDIVPRRDFTAEARRQFRCIVINKYQNDCPCCRQTKLENGIGEEDHFLGRELNAPEHGWFTCSKCNSKMAHDALFKASRRAAFEVFQELRRQMFGNGPAPKSRKGAPTTSSDGQFKLKF